MKEPSGALQPTGNSGFVDRDTLREIRTENWPAAAQCIEELALYECIDGAGRTGPNASMERYSAQP